MIDCSKTENYFAEKQRMTKRRKLYGGAYMCELDCTKCPLCSLNNASGSTSCSDYETFYPEKTIEIVQKWSNEHPRKTYLSEFLKHYPNTPLNNNGTPAGVCPCDLGLMSVNNCRKHFNCVKCWHQPIEEREKERSLYND